MASRARGAALFAVAISVIFTSCSGGLSGAPSPSPTPKPALTKADERFFNGDYTGAEEDYQKAIQDGVRGAHAHYSLLLAYETRFYEAVSEARAAVDSDADSVALGRLTRALDWSNNPSEAVAAGARAVATKPVDPLAYLFYAEALTDAGRYGEAVRQLRAAEGAVKDSYGRAEVYREWANYYGSQGDLQQQLNNIQLAEREQPAFPERSQELARVDYAAGKVQSARSVIDRVRKKHSRDYWVLNGLGDGALIGKDADTAESLYQAALDVRPAAPEASLARAEIDVALKRDFAAGHDVALTAFKKNPTSLELYEFLRHLDLLVLRTDPKAELGAPTAEVTSALAGDRKSALDTVNGMRAAAGLPAVSEDAALAEGAQAHAYYYLFNLAEQSLSGLGIHSESPNLPGFTGSDALQRARRFGYSGNATDEVIDHVYVPQAAIFDWTNSVFHRLPLLQPESQQAGFGEAQVGLLSIAVMDFGIGAGSHAAAVTYPFDGQKNVPAAFAGNEIPDPAPQGAEYPLGYPITLQAGYAARLSVSSGRLLGPDGKEVLAYELKPGQPLDAFDWALIPAAPLQPGVSYTVEVLGTLDGQQLSRRWSFTVIGS